MSPEERNPDAELNFTREELTENDDEAVEREDGFEPFRDVPVGTGDPNIVGDVRATDVPPGRD